MSIRPDRFAPPSAESFSLLFDHHVASGEAARAQSVIDSMRTEIPTREDYKALLRAWTLDATGRSASRAQDLLEEKLVPGTDPDCFVWMIECWCRSAENRSASKARHWLFQMEDAYRKSKDERMRPPARLYKSVLEACAVTNSPNAAPNAQRILNRLEASHKRKESHVRPDKEFYKIVLRSWAAHASKYPHSKHQASEKAVDLLRQMEKSELLSDGVDGECYGMVIEVLSRDKPTPSKASFVDGLLAKMEDRYKRRVDATLHYPTAVDYKNVVSAYANSNTKNAPPRIESVLRRFLRRVDHPNGDLLPDADIFQTALLAHKGDSPDSPHRAEDLLRLALRSLRLHPRAEPPATPLHNSLLDVCCHVSRLPKTPPRDVLLVALRAVRRLRQDPALAPDAQTHLLLAQTCANLLKTPRRHRPLVVRVLRNAFLNCVGDGLLTRPVLDLYRTCDPAGFRKLMLRHDADSPDALPREWTRNVKGRLADGGASPVDVFGVDDRSAPPNAPPETFRVKKNQALLRGARAP